MQEKPVFDFLSHAKDWLLLILINTGISVAIMLVNNAGFWQNMLYSQIIGISIALLITLLTRYQKRQAPTIFIMLLSIVTGVSFGIILSQILLSGFDFWKSWQPQNTQIMLKSVLLSLLIAVMITAFFAQRAIKLEMQKKLIKEQLKYQQAENQLSATKLKLLQAQIEPHFLFNTLSNVVSLIDTQPEQAKSMLHALTQYLRVGLKRTRETQAQVADEVKLLQAYLQIQKIRMGARLQYQIDVDKQAENLPLPPLLIQPLVENAIKHGLEKQIEGGRVDIGFYYQAQQLVIEVKDSGSGLEQNNAQGIGLQNIAQRLKSLYADKASLQLLPNQEGGLLVRITINEVAPNASVTG